ncbi:peptide deformylase [Candidatus Poribacteria bacterium]|nr:peptide deformylase [Candidatus Poribacteria bacterium]
MAIFDLRVNEDPILRQKATEVQNFDTSLSVLTNGMFDTMHEAKGIGLAAPQIGVSQRIIVIDIEDVAPDCPPMALVNPKITQASGEALGEEGCLSLPDFRAIVRRATGVSIQAQTVSGESVGFDAEGLMARVLQHEVDHLDGILITDRLLPEDQELLEDAN